jgi:hypothetical protein
LTNNNIITIIDYYLLTQQMNHKINLNNLLQQTKYLYKTIDVSKLEKKTKLEYWMRQRIFSWKWINDQTLVKLYDLWYDSKIIHYIYNK